MPNTTNQESNIVKNPSEVPVKQKGLSSGFFTLFIILIVSAGFSALYYFFDQELKQQKAFLMNELKQVKQQQTQTESFFNTKTQTLQTEQTTFQEHLSSLNQQISQ